MASLEAQDLAELRRRERALARLLQRREAESLARIRRALGAAIDRVALDLALDRGGLALSADTHATRTRLQIRRAIPEIALLVGAAIAEARSRAREGATAPDLDEEIGRPIEVPDAGVDDAFGHAAAASLAAAWGLLALRAVTGPKAAEPAAWPKAIHATAAAMDGRVRRTAATETALAFHDERARAIELLYAPPIGALPSPAVGGLPSAARGTELAPPPPAAPGGRGPYREPAPAPAPLPRLVKVWSAMLDLKVCAECARMHGTVVLAHQELPGGDPPRHPFCQCIPVILATELPLSAVAAEMRRAA
jgi:hypothetical protein